MTLYVCNKCGYSGESGPEHERCNYLAGEARPVPPPIQGSPVLGATGQFPEGKLNADDKGQVRFAVFADKGNVIISFGDKPITWMGMGPNDAIRFADALVKWAKNARLQKQRIRE